MPKLTPAVTVDATGAIRFMKAFKRDLKKLEELGFDRIPVDRDDLIRHIASLITVAPAT